MYLAIGKWWIVVWLIKERKGKDWLFSDWGDWVHIVVEKIYFSQNNNKNNYVKPLAMQIALFFILGDI